MWWCDGWVEARNGGGEGSHAIQCGGILDCQGGLGSGGVVWVGKGVSGFLDGFLVHIFITFILCTYSYLISHS